MAQWYSGKSCRLICMMVLTMSFFLVEIIVGYLTNSLALVGDSYHMLSDVVALLVGFASVKISKWDSHKNTYGWARAEVLGALSNSVFLIALCFTIFVEALERLTHTEEIKDPNLLLIVGSLGLLINILGLFLFAGHAHSHGGGGHGHSHGGSHTHTANNTTTEVNKSQARANPSGGEEVLHLKDNDAAQENSDGSNAVRIESLDEEISRSIVQKSSAQLNMRGVFLHVLGDALGSVIVIISALVIKFWDNDWRYKIDPILSLVLVTIILSTTYPLFKESAFILLQTVPTHIQVHDLKSKLLSKVDGIIAVHEFHIWQLAGNRIIASAHITCHNLRDYMRVAEEVKTFFHNEGIHSTTIQPEFIEVGHYGEYEEGQTCALECGPDKTCYPDTCCAKKPKKGENGTDSSNSTLIRQRYNNSTPVDNATGV